MVLNEGRKGKGAVYPPRVNRMIIRKNDLENMVKRLNVMRGYLNPNRLTVGAYRLDMENGYCIREVVNDCGAVRNIGYMYGMTARECYYFLSGLIEGVTII